MYVKVFKRRDSIPRWLVAADLVFDKGMRRVKQDLVAANPALVLAAFGYALVITYGYFVSLNAMGGKVIIGTSRKKLIFINIKRGR